MRNKTKVRALSFILAMFMLAGCGSNATNNTTMSESSVESIQTDSSSETESLLDDNTEEVDSEPELSAIPAEETVTEETTEDAEALAKAEEEAKLKAEEEAKLKAEEEARKKTEEERRAQEEAEKAALLTKTNSICMLNYPSVIAEKVSQSQNSKMFLEETSFSLLNNLYPNAVDKTTQTYVSNMARNITDLRMIAVKRDRLAFIYEQNKAKAMKEAMPSPGSVLNVVNSTTRLKALASVTFLAVDAYESYTSANAAVELSYLKDGWELDDAEYMTISENRIEAFNYMQNIIRDNGLDGDLALNSKAITDFVEWQNDTNVAGRIQFLERNESVYSAFGGYWLLLSKSYYENQNYKGCIAAIDTYIETQPRIFRKDTDFAAVLPYVVASLGEVYKGDILSEKEAYYIEFLCANAENDDWALNYFAAITYMDLYSKTSNKTYLQKAYSIAKNNVNELIRTQNSLNSQYLSDVTKQDVPKDATKAQKAEIENYNKMLKQVRETELPPVDNALLINVQLLFSLSEKLGISQTEKTNIDSILHDKGNSLFLVRSIDCQYWFSENSSLDLKGSLDGEKLTIPVSYVCDSSKIVVTVSHNGTTSTYDDWTIKEVKRPKGQSFESFTVTYISNGMKKLKIKAGDTATVEIYPYGDDIPPVKLQFKATEKKVLLYTGYEWELVK